MPITEACSGLLFYFHHRWLCDRGTAVLQLLYRCRISLCRLEIFRKTNSLPGYGIKHERESRTPVGERLTRIESGRGNYRVGSRSGSFFVDSIDKPGFFKLVHKRKSTSRSGLTSTFPIVPLSITCWIPLIVGPGERSIMNRHPPSNQQLHEIEIAPLWQRGVDAKKSITRGFSLCSADAILIFNAIGAWRKNRFILADVAARKIRYRPISCTGSYRRYPAASSRLPED